MLQERLVQWAEKYLLPAVEEGEIVKIGRGMEGQKIYYSKGELARVMRRTENGNFFVKMYRTKEVMYFRRASLRKLLTREVVELCGRFEEGEKKR